MYETTQLVGKSDLGISRILKELKVNKTTFCNGSNAYLEYGHEGLVRKHSRSNGTWSKINSQDRDKLVEITLEKPTLSSRELVWYITDHYNYYISKSRVYRILKAKDLTTTSSFKIMSASHRFHDKTTAVDQIWQTDFTYFKIFERGQYYFSTTMNDYSPYVRTQKLCSTMKAKDVKDT